MVPDCLSRRDTVDLSAIEDVAPILNLQSSHFLSEEYSTLKTDIIANQSRLPDLKIVDGFVYKRTAHSTGSPEQENESWKLWIPSGLVQDVIFNSHNPPQAAHCGIGKTLEKLRRYLFWPTLVKDVRNYILACETCKTTKSPNTVLRPPMGQPVKTSRPFQKLFIDLLGPYPRSKSGHVGIFIVLDHLSKYVFLKALKKFTTKPIIDFLEKDIFHLYGVPETIISDNGSQFKSGEFESFLTKYGIRHMFTAIHSPQSNSSERVNRSIIAAIRAFIHKNQNEWDIHLSSIACSLRATLHSSIGCSPYFVLFGQNMIQHGSDYTLLKQLGMVNGEDVSLQRIDKMVGVRDEVKRNIQMSFVKNATRYNTRSKPVEFKVGDEVYRRNFAQSNFEKGFNAKLAPAFIKARVKGKVGAGYYVLEDLSGKTLGTYHAKDIRR